MKDLRLFDHLMRIDLDQNTDKKTISLSQELFIRKALDYFGV